MNLAYKSISVALLSFSAISNASASYKQEIRIHTTRAPDSSNPTKACFTTTDLFDSEYCTSSDSGNFGRSNIYNNGPKNWVVETNYGNKYKVETDGSCTNFTGRTPHESGRLDIYVATADINYLDFFNKPHFVYKLTDCRTTWTPAP